MNPRYLVNPLRDQLRHLGASVEFTRPLESPGQLDGDNSQHVNTIL